MSDIANKAEQLKSKAKEKMGDWTGVQGMENQDMAQKAKAKAKKAAGDAKDTASENFNR